MADDPSRGFDPSVLFGPPAGLDALSASIRQQAAEQERSLQRVAAAVQEVQQAEFRRQAERDAHQRELVELQRKAAERQAQRDAEQTVRADAEARRKRNEIWRWVFTTSLALAGLTVAIIALVTR